MRKITFSTGKYVFAVLTFFYVLFVSKEHLLARVNDDAFACTGAVVNTFTYFESFNNNTGLWTQNTFDDNHNWSFDLDATRSPDTDPSGLTNGSHYLYYETSAPVLPEQKAIITSPCIELTGGTFAFFKFDYHMYSINTDMGTLQVDISDDAGISWTTVFIQSGSVQTNSFTDWITENIDLSPYLGNTITIRIRGIRTAGFRSDLAIDNVIISSEPLYCDSTANSTDTSGITSVIFNTINNSSSPIAQGYSDFTAISTTVQQGAIHDLTVHNNTLGNNTFNPRVWIDWTQDFDFDDAGETYNLGSIANVVDGPTSNYPLAITVLLGDRSKL